MQTVLSETALTAAYVDDVPQILVQINVIAQSSHHTRRAPAITLRHNRFCHWYRSRFMWKIIRWHSTPLQKSDINLMLSLNNKPNALTQTPAYVLVLSGDAEIQRILYSDVQEATDASSTSSNCVWNSTKGCYLSVLKGHLIFLNTNQSLAT